FVVTPASVVSTACLDELNHALSTKRTVIPLIVAQAPLPYRIERLQYVDFTSKEFRFAMAELRERLRAEEPQPLPPEQIRKNEHLASARINEEEQARLRAERRRARSRFSRPLPRYMDDVSFKDRQKELADLVNLLNAPISQNSRIIGVYGKAGIGKTALVCKVIADLERGKSPPDGIVPLQDTGGREVTESGIRLELILDDFAEVLPDGVQGTFEAARRDSRLSAAHKAQALLRAASSGRYLLLLDNLETLQDPESGALLDADLRAFFEVIAAQSQSVQILFTSRERLTAPSLPFKRSLLLERGLPTPDAIALLREGDPDNEAGLRDAPEEQLAQIAERVAGNPRRLEAVISMLKGDPTLTIAKLLDKPELLSAKAAEIVVQQAIQRLSEEARRLLEIAVIFNKPVPSSAIEYVSAPFLPNDRVAPLLRRLVSNHFLAFNRATGEYAMHPLDRSVHRERIPKGSRADLSAEPPPCTRYVLNRRAADYYKRLRKPRDQWRRYEDLTPQLEEFEHRMAVEDYDVAAALLTDIDSDLRLWGYARRVAELHERLQGKIADRRLAMISAGSLGIAYTALGQAARAIEYYQQALAIAREIGDRRSEGAWLGNLGNAYGDLGQVARAIEYYQQAFAIAREIGDRHSESAWLGSLGNSYRDSGQVARAIEYYEQALAIVREIGDRHGKGNHLGSLGNTYRALGQVARAIEYYEGALAIAREIGDRHGEGNRLGHLGYALALSGDTNTGKAHLREAIRILTEVGDVRLTARKQAQLAEVLLHAGELDEAQALLAQARQTDVPEANHELAALHGIVLARLN
ncbi:MAG: tetratricopeptide repeat protein, partial [Anaerolineae bacterium]|nr:tetratricopeptide repeat protein [Anaerolineae bacterium]